MRSRPPLLLLVALVAGCARTPAPPDAAPAPLPTVVAVDGALAPELRLAGIVAPLHNVVITAGLNEPAAVVNVRDGDRVRAGDVLARFDVTDLRANLEAAERSAAAGDAKAVQAAYQARLAIGQSGDAVRQAAAALRQAQATQAQDERDLARGRALLAQGFVAQQQVDQQRTRVQNDGAAVVNAQAALASARMQSDVYGNGSQGLQASSVANARADAASAHAQAAQIRAQITRATVIAPIDGVVTDRNLNPGEYPGNRTLFTLHDLDAVYVNLSATATELVQVEPGAAARVTVGGITAPLRGRVVALLGQTTPGATNFTIKVLIAEPDPRVRSGMPATASILTAPRRGTIVPASAFADTAHDRLAVPSGEGYRLVAVTELAGDGARSVVRGLAPGTAVARDGFAAANAR